ncbi:MAG: hypothetical protein WDW38_008424 [Sanguina aurantia]
MSVQVVMRTEAASFEASTLSSNAPSAAAALSGGAALPEINSPGSPEATAAHTEAAAAGLATSALSSLHFLANETTPPEMEATSSQDLSYDPQTAALATTDSDAARNSSESGVQLITSTALQEGEVLSVFKERPDIEPSDVLSLHKALQRQPDPQQTLSEEPRSAAGGS